MADSAIVETFETNVTAGYFVAAAFLPLLAKGTASKPGYSTSIVNVASISGMMRTSSEAQFAYASSKAAMIHLSKMLGTTLAQAKIRVNTICPGIFPSEMSQGKSDAENKSQIDGMGEGLPAGRPGNDQDMAAAILYLVGPASAFSNGQILYPDGGAVLTEPADM
jgi:NAD(P)-dependent dehydrogenase (short-subunit alcohol dehydrogenase family)